MASKPAVNKWKSVSKSVVGVLATKIAAENPDKIYDNLKSYLEKTKKQIPDLSSTEGTRDMLEERILKLRAIIATFDSRKNQLDNLTESSKSFSESIDINESNEKSFDNYESFRTDWNECEEKLKAIVQDSQVVLDEWRNVDELNDKIDNLLNQLESRRQSCFNLDSAIEITSRLQHLKEDNFKACDSIFKKLKKAVVNLMEKCKVDELVKVVDDVEEKMSKNCIEINDTINSLEKRVEEERNYVCTKDNFLHALEEDIEVLKNIRNQECDTAELQGCLAVIKGLKEKWHDEENRLQEIERQCKSLAVERYAADFDYVFQRWTKYTEDLNICQENLELQTSESRKVVYLLISAEREIAKKQRDLNDLQRILPADKEQLEEKIGKISDSLKSLSGLYETMENFTHQWEKLKKTGLTDDVVETKLQKASEKLNSLQYDFQTLLDKFEEILTVVVRIDEDCEKINKKIDGFSGYLIKVRLNEEDTNSDIQAKMSKIDQKLWTPCWDLMENAESLIESLPNEFVGYRSKVENLKATLEKGEKEFEIVGNQLSYALTCLDEFAEMCTKLNSEFVEMKESMPNLKKLVKVEDKVKAHNEIKSIEEKLKSMKQNELAKISNIQTNLSLMMFRKPAKDVMNKWKDLMSACLDSIPQLSQDILREQTKLSKQSEFKEWLESTKDYINQSIMNFDMTTFGDLELLHNNLLELRNMISEKTTDLKDFDMDFEREELQTQMGELINVLNKSLEHIASTSTVWQEFDHQLDFLTSWLNGLLRRANDAKLHEKLKDRIYGLKEVLFDLQSKESKINDLNDKAQTLNSMTNSFSVVQQSCSLINTKSQLTDEIEAELLCLERWSFIKSQLKSMIHQVSIINDKLQSIVVSNEDLEDHLTAIDEVKERLSVVESDTQKIISCDEFQQNLCPAEIMNEYSHLMQNFDRSKQDMLEKEYELQRLVEYANEQRLLSMAKSHECTPAVYETVDELPADYEVHYLSGRNASLKLNKYGKFRNRTSSGFMKRTTSKKGVLEHRKSIGENESNFSKSPSVESIVETVTGVTLSLAEISCPAELAFVDMLFPLSPSSANIESVQYCLPTSEMLDHVEENGYINFCTKSLEPVKLAKALVFPPREQTVAVLQENSDDKLETLQIFNDNFSEQQPVVENSLILDVPSGELQLANDYKCLTPHLCHFLPLPIRVCSSEKLDFHSSHIKTVNPIEFNNAEVFHLSQLPLAEKNIVNALCSTENLPTNSEHSLASNFPLRLANVDSFQDDEHVALQNSKFAYASATRVADLVSATPEWPRETFIAPDRSTLWDRLNELAAKVRSMDLHTPGRLAGATLKVLLAYLEYVHLLWHVHGNVDISNFDEIDLHQSIQFVQLDILQLIENCQILDTIDNVVSNI